MIWFDGSGDADSIGEDDMQISAITTYFLSGTGNTRRVASWMADEAVRDGVRTTLVPIDKVRPQDWQAQATGRDHLLLLAAPTHGFTTPWVMLLFALALPRGHGMSAAVVATRAGMRWGWFEPMGVAGSNPFLLALILWVKGYRVRGVLPVNMPSNWLSLHWGLHPRNIARCLSVNEPKTRHFMRRLLQGKRTWLTVSNLLEFFFAVVLSPVSALYLIIGRRWLAKLFFANSDCIGCGLCARTCPVGAIRMLGPENKRRPYWRLHCESCMRCMAYCPQQAVEAGHSWALISWYGIGAPVAAFAVPFVLASIPGLDRLNLPLLVSALEMLFFIPLLVLAYWGLHYLIAIPFFNRLFTWTTLTHWWRRYQEPTTRLTELTRISERLPDSRVSEEPGGIRSAPVLLSKKE